MNDKVKNFLNDNDFYFPDANLLCNEIIEDMQDGLKNKGSSYQMMTVSPYIVRQKNTDFKDIIVIDAGGTNFRSCIVSTDENGKKIIKEERKSSMIALDKELSKDEFYNQLADKIDYLKNKAETICFCFSYALEINDKGDGKVIAFSKQVKAKEVVGTYVANELKKKLLEHNWITIQNIYLVNDTISCLLSGLSLNDNSNNNYIGFILGTGINNAYVNDQGKITVCECGMYSNINKNLKQSLFDKLVDINSTNQTKSLLEKMCAGAYIKELLNYCIIKACNEGLLSSEFYNQFKGIETIYPYQMDLFLSDIDSTDNIIKNICKHTQKEDQIYLTDIFNALIYRSSLIVSSVLAATIIMSNIALPKKNKTIVICNGSTFWKTTGLFDNVKRILEDILIKKELNYELIKITNDITLGTSFAII